MTRTPILVLAAFAFTAAISAPLRAADSPEVQAAMAGIRPAAIRAHMRFLADDLLEGRGTGTRGYDIAARYVAARFEALGLEPAGKDGTYLQPVPFLRIHLVDDQSSFALIRDGKRTELKLDQDFILQSSTLAAPDSEVTAPLAYIGFGVHAPELGYDDFAGVDVKGRIVVVLSGAPARFPTEQRAFYSVNQFKVDEALARGAVGVIGVFTPTDARRLPWEAMTRNRKMDSFQWVTAAGVPYRSRPQLRGSGALNTKTAEALFAGAPHTLAEALAAAEAGKPLSFTFPASLQASLHTVSAREPATSPNVAALLRGSDPKLRDEVIVLTAHLDHLGIGAPVNGDAIYNGAYDNASGIASLLETASAFASLPVRPRRSLLFVAVTGEEKGLQGSEYFAHNPTVPGVVANLNVDMFLMLHPLHDLIAFGAEHSSLGPIAEGAARDFGLKLTPDPLPEEVIFIRSDQFSFVHEGIPAIFVNPGFSTDGTAGGVAEFQKWLQTHYHKPDDDMNQTFDWEAGTKFVQLNFLIAYRVAQDDATPSWNEGDFFGERLGKKAGK